MEALPNEITLDIAKKMTASECLALAQSSKQYAWLLQDASLWKYLAARDLKYPDEFFEEQLDTMSPAQLYQHLSRCQHQSSFRNTLYIKICGKPIFQGTPYCRDHCGSHHIRICPQCHNDFVNVINSKVDLEDPFVDLCFGCQTLACNNVDIQVRPVRTLPGYMMLINTPLCGIVLRQLPNGAFEALGRVDPTSSCGDSLIPLTHREQEIASHLGLTSKVSQN